MNRIRTTLALLVALALAAGPLSAQSNVLVILADDLGVDNVGAYALGPDRPATPVLDTLAQNGVLFRNAWANPVCSPTRAAILTGRYGIRTGIGNPVIATSMALPLSEITLPEMLDLGTAGAYTSAAFGKWHLSNDAVGGNDAPNLAGYDHYAGVLRNMGNPGEDDAYFNWMKLVNGTEVPVSNYATSENVDDALAWIGSQTGPWHCYMAFHAPHYPYHIPPAGLHNQDFSSGDTDRKRYKAMIEALDTEIGRLLLSLGSELDNTLVIVMGDNGTPRPVLAAGVPSQHSKWYLYEGGIHVPMIVSGPQVAIPGECEAFVHAVDVFATAAEVAGVDLGTTLPPGLEIDSISLVPYLQNPGSPSQRDYNYTEIFKDNGYDSFPFSNYTYIGVAATDGDYKLILTRQYFRHEPREMFDLQNDPYELDNLYHSLPLSQDALQHFAFLKQKLKQILR